MAEEKIGEDGYDVLWKLLGFLIVLFLVITIAGKAIYNFGGNNSSGDSNSSENRGDLSETNELSGQISLGDRVVSKEEVDVHDAPAGEIIGYQDKNAFGRTLEGPIDRFNQSWWRIDFEKRPDGWVSGSDLTNNLFWPKIINFFSTIFGWLQPFLIFISIIILALIAWVMIKKRDLDKLKKKKEEFKEEQKKYKEDSFKSSISDLPVPNLPIGDDVIKTENVTNKRWRNVQSLINSHSVNDWKQAIIESDVILEEMLEKMGYEGISVADKLKKVEPSDFLTLNSAWEAHKIRNLIAHKGSDYILSKDKAEDTINKFKEVFEEFYFI